MILKINSDDWYLNTDGEKIRVGRIVYLGNKTKEYDDKNGIFLVNSTIMKDIM